MAKDNPTRENPLPEVGSAPGAEPPATFESLVAAMPGTTRRFGAGESVYHQGEHETRLCLVLEGWLAMPRDIEGGAHCLVDFALQGDMLGCILCQDWRTPHGAVCVTEAWLRVAPRGQAMAALTADPRLDRYVARCRACSAFREQDHLANVVLRRAEARVAHMLLELCCRVLHGGPRRPAGGVVVPLGLRQMGAALGLTSVHLSRSLKTLREAGIVAIERRRIRVLDPPALARRAGSFNPALADPLPGWSG